MADPETIKCPGGHMLRMHSRHPRPTVTNVSCDICGAKAIDSQNFFARCD